MNLLLMLQPAFPIEQDRREALTMILKYKLDEPLQKLEERIYTIAESSKRNSLSGINQDILSLFSEKSLTEINQITGSISPISEKYFVKAAVGKICSKAIRDLLLPHLRLVDFDNWVAQIRQLCLKNKLVFDDLNAMIDLDSLRSAIAQQDANRMKPDQMQGKKKKYLRWNCSRVSLANFADKLKSKEYIRSVRGFKSLFDEEQESTPVHFNEKYFGEILALFDLLKKEKWITPKGTRGIWDAIGDRALNMKEKKLMSKDPKRHTEEFSRNKEQWQILREKAERFLHTFKT